MSVKVTQSGLLDGGDPAAFEVWATQDEERAQAKEKAGNQLYCP